MPAWQWHGDDLVLMVRVQPRASRDELVGFQDAALKVRLTAAPVDGKANAALLKFLGKVFGVAPTSIVLESGETGRNKRLRIPSPRSLPASISRATPQAT
jgi:hypothetical protein